MLSLRALAGVPKEYWMAGVSEEYSYMELQCFTRLYAT